MREGSEVGRSGDGTFDVQVGEGAPDEAARKCEDLEEVTRTGSVKDGGVGREVR